MRVCTICKRELDESYFNINRARKDGLTTNCKDCQKAYNDKRKLKPKIILSHKICTVCHKDLNIDSFNLDSSSKDGHEACCRACQKNNKARQDYYKERQNEIKPSITHKFCNTCGKDLDIKYFHKNINTKDGYFYWCVNCQREYAKTYYNDTLESRREIRKEQSRKRNLKVSQDPMQKLNSHMSSIICSALKGNKAEQHWEDLVGYTLQELREHLESQFDENMNWNNQGKYWEIDHIIPKNLFHFDSADSKEFKICWSLMNLRPLSSYDNMHRPRKGQDVPEDLKNRILNQKL